MNELKNILATVAPGLATALGGPLAGAAVGMLAKRFTGDEKASESTVVEAVKQAVNNYGTDPNARIAFAELENQWKIVVQQEHTKALEIEGKDRADARERDVKIKLAGNLNLRADLLAAGAWLMNLILLWLLFHSAPDGWQRDAYLLILGAWLAITKDTYMFEFGSSRGSKDKADELKGKRS